MKLVTKSDITWFKTVSDKIRGYLISKGYEYTKDVMDSTLKGYATIQSEIYDELTEFNKSCTEYTHKEMQLFKDLVKLYAIEVGYGDLDENDGIDFNPERIDQ